jgi:ornithine cyclodeaminase
MLVLSRSEVEQLLDLDQLVDAIALAMADLSAGRASMPPRLAATAARGLLGAMPAYLPSARALMAKLVSVFPDNTAQPTHQAVICCFDPDTGSPTALIDGTYITATRTAAGSALAAKLLANPDASTVAIIGTGVQARSHALALARLPQVARVLIAGRDPAKVAALAGELHAQAASIEEAVRAAQIVCLATHASAPVIRREWLSPGTHVSSVGYNIAGRGELDPAIVRDAFVVVESRAAALAPPPSGAIELRDARVEAELGELVAGGTGRTSRDQLTLYKSVGVAVQDAAAAALVLRVARERGVGVEVST